MSRQTEQTGRPGRARGQGGRDRRPWPARPSCSPSAAPPPPRRSSQPNDAPRRRPRASSSTRAARTRPARPSCGPLAARPGRSRSSRAGRSTAASARGPSSWSVPTGGRRERSVRPRAGPPLTRTARRPRARRRPSDRMPCSSSTRSASLLAQALLLEHREPVVAQAVLGQRGQLVGERLGRRAGLARRHHPVDQPHGVRLGGTDRPAGEDQVQGPPGADEPGQPHRAAVDEGHAPASAEDAERRVLGGHPQVAPDGQLEPARDGVTLDGGDHRLAQPHPGGAHRAVRAGPRPDGPGCRTAYRSP